jgi:hypothetical protein
MGIALSLSACNSTNATDNEGPLEISQESSESTDSKKTGAPSPNVPITPSENLDSLFKKRSFDQSGKRMVSADFKNMNLSLQFDVSKGVAYGKAVISFRVLEEGTPYFLMSPSVKAAQLDHQSVAVKSTNPPGSQTTIKYLDTVILDQADHTMTIEYELPSSEVTFSNDGIGFITSMADITDGNFFESYGPANFEHDQFKMTAELMIQNATSEHRLFTNGASSAVAENHWRIEFPEFYNTSSFYIHLTQTAMTVRELEYEGLIHTIPITIYSRTASAADQAANQIKGLFKELESTYGPYMHPAFTAYVSGSGGMEHAGATITSLSALGHELTHSWFARGVQPEDGRSGWIDEGIANWRDTGYPRGVGSMTRTPTNLANFSLFSLFTPYNAYNDGSALMSGLDGLFAAQFGGLRPVLKSFFDRWKGNIISTDIFKNDLESRTGVDLDEYFNRYVYSNESVYGATGSAAELGVNHPLPITHDRAIELR